MRLTISALALSALLLAGCGAATEGRVAVHPVRGQLLTADGMPAAGAVVTFHPVGHGPYPFTPHGIVGKDGTFALTSYAAGDGAPAGDYVVTAVWRTTDPDGEQTGPDRLKGKAADPASPIIRVAVKDTETAFDAFRLK